MSVVDIHRRLRTQYAVLCCEEVCTRSQKKEPDVHVPPLVMILFCETNDEVANLPQISHGSAYAITHDRFGFFKMCVMNTKTTHMQTKFGVYGERSFLRENCNWL